MAKWPDVPAVFGWLGLDRRGQWRIRGERISNETANRFIDRNYTCDESGRWFFQNGPQRVFVSLAYAPWVLGLDGVERLRTHTGKRVREIRSASVDEAQNLTLLTEHGAGLVDDRDLAAVSERFVSPAGERLDDDALADALDALSSGRPAGLRLALAGGPLVPVRFAAAGSLPERFGFVRDPV